MKVGVTLRNMGPQSQPDVMLAGARLAEELGFDSVWITDHIAIPPDDAEGSGGRYTDPLTTLAWLGGATSRIDLGVGVLVVPYRPPLPTAKAIATVQELTGNRLQLGLGVGWMDAEFRALGVDRSQRGRLTDEFLEFLASCFSDTVVRSHGQSFLFEPKPAMPPVYLGGQAEHALPRARRFGHGWLPMVRSPEQLADALAGFDGPVTVMAGLPLEDVESSRKLLRRYSALGVERLVCAVRYETLASYETQLRTLAEITNAA